MVPGCSNFGAWLQLRPFQTSALKEFIPIPLWLAVHCHFLSFYFFLNA